MLFHRHHPPGYLTVAERNNRKNEGDAFRIIIPFTIT